MCFRRSAHSEDSASIHSRLARLANVWLELMRQGQYAQAWRISDLAQELHRKVDCSSWPRHTQFLWDGAPLNGRRVLIRCYRGLGDTIQFARFVPWLREVASDTALWAQPHLIPLLRTIRNIGTVLPLHDGVPDVERDADMEISELMHVFRVTPQTLSAQIPYLHVPREYGPRTRFNVGVVWQSGDWDVRRSIPCALLQPLASVANVDVHVFQHGAARQEWRAPCRPLRDYVSVLDEARAMRELDVLICVDTFAAHLGGALGVPVWLLLHADPDWRWMRQGETSPWYPNMRLFRQPRQGDWSSVVARVRAQLERHAAASPQRLHR